MDAQAQCSVIPLHYDWIFRQAGTAEWHPAQVPGEVHTDLLRNLSIPDPYRNFNADSVQWIEDQDWEYACTIQADAALLRNEHVDLVFKGLDTFAEVWLNDSLLGRVDNMFRTWEWPVEKRLRPGANKLRVVFRSAVREGEKRRKSYGIGLPHDSDPTGASPYVRKAAYQFGWDFAPRMVGCGIWQPVELCCWNGARIRDLNVKQRFTPDSIRLDLRIQTNGSPGTMVHCFLDGVPIGPPMATAPSASIIVNATIPRKALWWPNGTGEHVLHNLRVELRIQHGVLWDSATHRIGLRSVELHQDPDSIGRSFTFVVNGKPMFMKGCNIVPPDLFPSRAGDSAWVALVADMQRAHMNMVRVWAGGIYPPDAFFDALDTAGILVWQDFMLADLVPTDSASLANMMQEAREQAARFALHPCAALLCGNNELDVAWSNWGWQDKYDLHGADSARVIEGNRYLWKDLLGAVAAEVGLPYTWTSPLSNWGNAAGLRSGDLHYWGVWHGDADFASFADNVGRFVSEYGFQSWPDSAMLAKYIDPKQLHLGSASLRYRQRSYKTDAPILKAIEHELGEAPKTLGRFIKDSQAVQAKAYQMAIQAQMAAQPRCMGTLFWQLNDCWPGPSWSLIDYEGNRKPGMIAVQRLYGH
jgi:beta-mannosidase